MSIITDMRKFMEGEKTHVAVIRAGFSGIELEKK
jgi:hypothetical protein